MPRRKESSERAPGRGGGWLESEPGACCSRDSSLPLNLAHLPSNTPWLLHCLDGCLDISPCTAWGCGTPHRPHCLPLAHWEDSVPYFCTALLLLKDCQPCPLHFLEPVAHFPPRRLLSLANPSAGAPFPQSSPGQHLDLSSSVNFYEQVSLTHLLT